MPKGPTRRPRATVPTVREGRELEAEAMPRGAVRICFDGSWTPVLRVELEVRLPTCDFVELILQFNREHFTSDPARPADFSWTEAAIRALDRKEERRALRSFHGEAVFTQKDRMSETGTDGQGKRQNQAVRQKKPAFVASIDPGDEGHQRSEP